MFSVQLLVQQVNQFYFIDLCDELGINTRNMLLCLIHLNVQVPQDLLSV